MNKHYIILVKLALIKDLFKYLKLTSFPFVKVQIPSPQKFFSTQITGIMFTNMGSHLVFVVKSPFTRWTPQFFAPNVVDFFVLL